MKTEFGLETGKGHILQSLGQRKHRAWSLYKAAQTNRAIAAHKSICSPAISWLQGLAIAKRDRKGRGEGVNPLRQQGRKQTNKQTGSQAQSGA